MTAKTQAKSLDKSSPTWRSEAGSTTCPNSGQASFRHPTPRSGQRATESQAAGTSDKLAFKLSAPVRD